MAHLNEKEKRKKIVTSFLPTFFGRLTSNFKDKKLGYVRFLNLTPEKLN